MTNLTSEFIFMKLPLIYTDISVKHVVENHTLSREAPFRSIANSARCLLHVPLTVADSVCSIQNAAEQCTSRSNFHAVDHFFFMPSACGVLHAVF
jgi:hypothetical protein